MEEEDLYRKTKAKGGGAVMCLRHGAIGDYFIRETLEMIGL